MEHVMRHGTLILKIFKHVIAGKRASTWQATSVVNGRATGGVRAAGKPHLFASASEPPSTLDPGR
jgi:hypothetical protein